MGAALVLVAMEAERQWRAYREWSQLFVPQESLEKKPCWSPCEFAELSLGSSTDRALRDRRGPPGGSKSAGRHRRRGLQLVGGGALRAPAHAVVQRVLLRSRGQRSSSCRVDGAR